MPINSKKSQNNGSNDELRKAKRQLEALISSSFDAIIAIDPDKKIVTFNKQAEDLLGYSSEELEGHSGRRLYEDVETARKIHQTVQETGKIDHAEVILVHKHNVKVPALLSAKLIRDDQGKVLGQVGYLRDLREVRLLETRLQALIATSTAIDSTHEEHEILELVVSSALSAIPSADRAAIHFFDEQISALILMISSFDISQNGRDALTFAVGEGVAGWVFQHAQPVLISDVQQDKRYKPIGNAEIAPHRSMICVPITGKEKKIGVISLAHSVNPDAFTDADLSLLKGYADQAAVAFDTADRFARMKKEADELLFLHDISLKINAQTGIEDILMAILEDGNLLLGTEMAVVHWKGKREGEYKTFVAPPELADFAIPPRFEAGLTAEIFQNKLPIVIPDTEKDERVNPRVKTLGIQSLIGYPLQARGQVAGALFFNSRQLQHFGEHEKGLIALMLPQAAVAIENSYTIVQHQRNRKLSESLVKVSRTLTRTNVLAEQLNAVRQFFLDELQAPMFYLGLYDDLNDAVDLKINFDEGSDQELISIPLRDRHEWTISSYVVKKRRPITWFNEREKREECQLLGINPLRIRTACQTCLAYPLGTESQTIGVISMQSQEPYAWDEIEVSAFFALAHQTAIAIQNTRLLEERQISLARLQTTYQTSEKIIAELAPGTALKALVTSVCNLVDASRACAVLIDENGKPYHLESDGFDEELTIANAFRPGGISEQVHQSGNAEFFDDISQAAGRVHPKMIEQGIRAAACLPLNYKDRRLGVLWAHYPTARRFKQAEKDALVLFTNQASIAYENARLHEQLDKAKDWASQVARATVLENLRTTMETLAQGIKDVLQCDIVTLYTYRQERDEFDFPPAIAGQIRNPGKVTETGRVDKGAAPYLIIVRDSLYVARDTPNDPVLNTPFTTREGVLSSVGTPLIIHGKRVGVLFINYCRKHTITDEKLENIDLFAHQAAVAIENNFLFEEEQQRRRALEILNKAGRAVTGSLDLDTIFRTLARQAHELSGKRGTEASFASITLVRDDETTLEAVYPEGFKDEIISTLGRVIDLNMGINGRIGVIGKAIKEKRPQLVPDVSINPDYLPSHSSTQSELAVPIIYGVEVVGVINVEHDRINGLDKDDLRDLDSLAAHAAVAIQNARHFQHLNRKSRHQEAVYQASKIISANIAASQKELLDLLLEQQVIKIVPSRGGQNVLGSIHLYDKKNKRLTLECIYPVEAFETHQAGEIRSLFQNNETPIGITGRTALSGRPQRVDNVDLDPDYLKFSQRTRSELDVPMVEGGQVIGVLSLESDRLNGFDEEDQNTLQSYAELAVIAIQNTRRYQELIEEKARVGDITAVAWMGLVASAWRHSIGILSDIIADHAKLIAIGLDSGEPRDTIDASLNKIQEIVDEIHTIPMLPLYDESGMKSVDITQLVRDRVNQYRVKKDRYKGVRFDFLSMLDSEVTVRVSTEWLRRILDILIDNAVNYMKESKEKIITVAVNLNDENESVEIRISDTGSGIKEEMKKLIFKKPIPKAKGDKGSGLGLYLANTIIHGYNGELYLSSTGPQGTTMVIRLPLEK